MKTKRKLVLATLMLLVPLVEAHLAILPSEAEAEIALTITHDMDLRLLIDCPQRMVYLDFEPNRDLRARLHFVTRTRLNEVSQRDLFRFSDHEWLDDPQAMAELLLVHIRAHLVSEA